MAVIEAHKIRVTRLDADGCPTEESTEVNAFEFSTTGATSQVIDLQTYEFTIDMRWASGGQRLFMEAAGLEDLWKKMERVRKRNVHRALKRRRR